MTDDSVLQHYGVLRRSGRYPWGSGQDPEQGQRDFLKTVSDLKTKGMSEVDIAKGFGLTVADLRSYRTVARNSTRKADISQALRLSGKGMSNVAIGQRMGISESSVRGLLSPANKDKEDSLITTANFLENRIKETGGYLDIGIGTANHLSIPTTKLSAAVSVLRGKGYEVRNVQVDQLGTGPGMKTTVKVLVPPDSPKFIDPAQIHTVAAYSEDGGRTYDHIEPPKNVDLSRVGVRYAEDGGGAADGVIYVRPGVEDVSLGSSRYAQVRIAVNGTHYLKGMAMYKADMPPGVDLLFNTNKHNTGNKLDAMKPQKDEENPFGATIRQKHYIDGHGNKQLSPMNIVHEEGNWRDWSRSLSSQVLSKQSPALAKRQLGLALADRKDELDEILRLTNPVVKENLLRKFADGADSAAVHLKAAALPRQGTHAILPIESLKPNEIYAPNYLPGERVALIRFPHGGTFEIPELTVNNKNTEARGALSDSRGHAIDAVGIHPSVAARLSGADFDGDSVLVIPNNRGDLHTSPPLKGLENFDPREAYAPYDGMKTIDGGTYNTKTGEVDYHGKTPSGRAKQTQMGDVSNLITDMSVKGATQEELARAVRHSMVVIDAEKHHLNVKQSYLDNGIKSLKEKYQGRGKTGRLAGASTIVSRSGNATVHVLDRRLRKASEGGPINPQTGEKVYVLTGKTKYDPRTGKEKPATTESKPLAEVRDAHELSSGQPIENIYADHSNSLKALANEARKASLSVGKLVYSPTAARAYKAETDKLNSDLNYALKKKPLERQAQLVANAAYKARLAANPGLDGAAIKKIKNQELNNARARFGLRRFDIEITDRQWRAIQEGAVAPSKLRQILEHADPERVRKLATPRAATVVTPAKLAIAKARLASGYPQSEIAASLGIPVSTLNSALHREGG